MVRIEICVTWIMFMELLISYPVICVAGSTIACQHGSCQCVNKFRVNCSGSLPSTLATDTEVLVLDISSNNLTSLNASVLPSQLKALQVCKNRITAINQLDVYTLQNLIFLHLDHNSITFIHPRALVANKRLEILTLSGNRFQSSEPHQPFIRAPKLRVLDVSNCGFRYISGAMFAKLPLLEDLRLPYNRIRTLEEGTFQHLKSLRSLLLRGNLLSKIQKGSFTSLRTLEVLDLADNSLSSLGEPEIFSPLTALRYLDLSENGLKHIHPKVFSNLCSLQVLYLYRNELNDLSEVLLQSLRHLTTLDVSDNSLEAMPHYTTFCENSKLTYLKLTNSFMNCDNCSVWNIWEWKNNRNIAAFFAKCNGTNIDDFFNTYQARQGMLQSVSNCSHTPNCESVPFEEIPKASSFSLYIYAIAGVIFFSLLLLGVLVSFILLRSHFNRKQKTVISVTHFSSVRGETKVEESYISEELKKRQELFRKDEDERLKLQRELFFQHQKTLKKQQQERYKESLERSRQREGICRNLTEEGRKANRNSQARYSYRDDDDASRLPSIADDEKEWCRADTLPAGDKPKTVHKSLGEDRELNKKTEAKRYSADEAQAHTIDDEYWHAKKSGKGSKTTNGVTILCDHPMTVAFCPSSVPSCTEKSNEQVL